MLWAVTGVLGDILNLRIGFSTGFYPMRFILDTLFYSQLSDTLQTLQYSHSTVISRLIYTPPLKLRYNPVVPMLTAIIRLSGELSLNNTLFTPKVGTTPITLHLSPRHSYSPYVNDSLR